MVLRADHAFLDNDHPPKENAMDRNSLKQRLVLITLAALASTSTFALMVLAPMAASGGLA
jgi:hypothetical protein